jgi:hypothetical protein
MRIAKEESETTKCTLFKSTDRGTNWTTISSHIEGCIDFARVGQLEADSVGLDFRSAKAASREAITQLAIRSRFGGSEIETDGIGFELRLKS